jgi:DNA helicase TIP49 (TBP-interacting protein)
MSVLIEGAAFTGKTALAASSAVNSGFPFVRKICADEMVSFTITTIICHTALVTMLTGTPTDL